MMTKCEICKTDSSQFENTVVTYYGIRFIICDDCMTVFEYMIKSLILLPVEEIAQKLKEWKILLRSED